MLLGSCPDCSGCWCKYRDKFLTYKQKSCKICSFSCFRVSCFTDAGGTDTVRFGRLHSGEIAQLRLWLANETSGPVVIAKYGRSCGCTTLEYDNQPINAGDAQQVTLTFDARGEWGWQLKTLDVSFAGARSPLRLFIEAEVE